MQNGYIEDRGTPDHDLLTEALRALPKIELHAHLSGCIRLSTIEEIARSVDLRLPPAISDDLRQAVVLDRPAASHSESFAAWPRVIDRITSLPSYHYRLAYEVAVDMAADGVVYAEIRASFRLPFDPLAFHDMLREIDRAARDAQRDSGIDVRYILGFNRQRFMRIDEEERVKIVEQVLASATGLDGRVVGFDLYGSEVQSPPRGFASMFELVREAGYPLSIHAGEAGSPEHVAEAIMDLGCSRLSHGVLMIASPRLVELARSHGVGIEVCLTSNRLTGAVPDLRTHPVKTMLAAGLRIAICADNTLVYDTSLSAEYAIALRAGLLDISDVLDLAFAASTLAFLPSTGQRELAERVRQEGDLRSATRRRIEDALTREIATVGGR